MRNIIPIGIRSIKKNKNIYTIINMMLVFAVAGI